jgi:hypothetical protein
MSYNNENHLFLTMAQGGQMTPEMMQMAQQSGQLPQMDMGAGLNDIQKMNMRQQAHYGNSMFRYGGVPHMANGGEDQEDTDQQFLSPYKKYNGRVQDFLQQLRSKAMNVVQDEMVNTANDYDAEAANIDAENQMRYGGNYYADGGQPTFSESGLNAVDAWNQASQNQTNLTQGMANTIGFGSNLKGYFGQKDGAAFNDNPLNNQYIKKATTTDLATGDTDRIHFAPGGPYFPPSNPIIGNLLQGVGQPAPSLKFPYLAQNQPPVHPNGEHYDAQTIANAKVRGWGDDVAGYEKAGWVQKPGTKPPELPKTSKVSGKTSSAAPKGIESTVSPEEQKKKELEAAQKKAEEDKAKAGEKKDETKTETKTETKPEDKKTKDVGDGLDPWRVLADPNSTQAGAAYQLDKKGHKIPMAFYDPNMRIINEKVDFRNPIGNIFRSKENDRQGHVMKSASYTFGTLDHATQVPDIKLAGPTGSQQNPQQPVTLAPGVTRPDLMPQDKPVDNFFENGLLPKAPQSNDFSPLLPGQSPLPNPVPNQTNQFFPRYSPSTWYAGMPVPARVNGDNSYIDDQWQQAAANWHPGMQWNGPQNLLPYSANQGAPASAGVPATSSSTGNQPLTPKQIRENGRAQRAQIVADGQAKIAKMYEDANANQQHKYGGEGLRRFVPGGPTTSDSNPFGEGDLPGTKIDQPFAPVNPAPGPTYGDGPLDKPMQIGKIYQTDSVTPTNQIDYKFGKNNPFFAPAMMAGLRTAAGGFNNMDAKKKQKEMRGRLSSDQVYSKMNPSSGVRGDYTFNEGTFRPDNKVPSPQFSGYNFQSNYAARGGEMSEGDEMYLDEDTINAILAAGGQIEYLD